MSGDEATLAVIGALETIGIAYMVVGSLAATGVRSPLDRQARKPGIRAFGIRWQNVFCDGLRRAQRLSVRLAPGVI
jgi:hypothetical protein